MLTAFLASLACLALRSESLATIAEATGEWTRCDDCSGYGESFAHDPTRAISCPSCQGHGERVVSAWDSQRDGAHRAVLAATLVDRSPLPAARARAAALRTSLEMTVATTRNAVLLRGCPCCHEVSDARGFEDDGLCERCHIIDFGALEADLERWPAAPPCLPWQRDADASSLMFAEVA